MKPIIYPVAVLAGVYATLNTFSFMFAFQNITASHLISKTKYEIIINDETKSRSKTLCPTELKIQQELKIDKNLMESLLETFV